MPLAAIGLLVLLPATALAAAAALRGSIGRRVAAFQATSALIGGLVVLLAAALDEPAFLDIALAFALLGLIGTLVLARFLERWL